MDKLKFIIKENLNKRYQMNESFEKIFMNENNDVRFNLTIEHFGKLIDEGYDNEQLENVIDEQFDWIKKMFTPGNETSNTQDVSTQNSLLGGAGKNAMYQFREYAIGKLLNLIGFEGKLANMVATLINDMSLMDLISMFRSKNGCLANGGVVGIALVDAMVRYIVETGMKQDSVIANFLRQSMVQYFKSHGYEKQIGVFLCNAIEDYKSK